MRTWFETLDLENPFHAHEPYYQNDDTNDKGHERPTTVAAAAVLSHHDWTAGFRRGIILEIRIAVYGDRIGGFKCLEIRTHVHVEKFSVDEEKSFCVGEAGELGEILVFDFLQAPWTDLGYAGGFIEREVPREACFLQFFTEAFHENSCGARLYRGIEVDENLARLRAFAGT